MGLAAGMVAVLVATFMWLTRAPFIPSFVSDHPNEHIWSYVAGTYRHTAADIACYNVKYPLEKLLDEIQHTGGPKNIDPLTNYRGYSIRYLDGQGPFMSIELTQARMTWSKSFFYYDNQYPASFSDGWTSVEIIYRPTVRSWLNSFWRERLGGKLEVPKGVLAKQGLTRY